jgi:hypothetical protein
MNETLRQTVERDLETRKRILAEATEVARLLQAKSHLTRDEELTLRMASGAVAVQGPTVNALADQLGQMPANRRPLPKPLKDAFAQVPGKLREWASGLEPCVSQVGSPCLISTICTRVLEYDDEQLPEAVFADIVNLFDDRDSELKNQLLNSGRSSHVAAHALMQAISDRRRSLW